VASASWQMKATAIPMVTPFNDTGRGTT
jgi:hypothetical protein